MQIGTKVQLRESGPIFGITDIDFDICYHSFGDIPIIQGRVRRIKVDNQWYDPKEFDVIFKVRKDLK